MDQQIELPRFLQESLIPSLPTSAYYIPNFITVAEEEELLHKINTAPQPIWKHLAHRRLQAHPSPLSPSNTLLDASLPKWLSEPFIPRLLSIPVSPESQEHIFSLSPHSRPNHCLINEYQVGEGIHSHLDGDAYYPCVSTISLQASIVLDIFPKPDLYRNDHSVPQAVEQGDKGWRVLQEPRSLLITTGDLYTKCMHGIEAIDADSGLDEVRIANWSLLGNKEEYKSGHKARDTRVSLTFRDVIRVKKVGKAFSNLIK